MAADDADVGEKRPREPDGSEESDDERPSTKQRQSKVVRRGNECPYIDTVSRQNLDFDFEKCCSVTLSRVNVYCCLVCGHYYQGRGRATPAYTHALEDDHHMFMKLESGDVWCLPDGYQVVDRSLDDIRAVLDPAFTAQELAKADSELRWRRALDGSDYMPGLIGLNNMRANDYANVVVQALNRCTPLRNFFLRREKYAHCKSLVVQRFGELVRKMWNPRAFKGQVSPHEFMHAIMDATSKRFVIDLQSDPVDLVQWLLNTLHLELTGGKRKKRSVISDNLQGELEVTTEAGTGTGEAATSATDVVRRVPFLTLGLDLPPAPLFKDVMEENIIPQVMLSSLLAKYDGGTVTEDVNGGRRRFRITKLPPCVIMHVKRFSRSQFLLEKNPTVVNYPAREFNIGAAVPVPPEAQDAKYDLAATIVHEGSTRMQARPDVRAMPGLWSAYVHRRSEDLWYAVQDLAVTEVLPQQVVLAETYVCLWERNEGKKETAEKQPQPGR
ncbi:unnamed protein product [Pedinophyceae sp. YPF-701]|nr:unnamed protein product [Pedinophyceae sp. YPF-701]